MNYAKAARAQKKKPNSIEKKKKRTYEEMGDIDDGPGHAGCAIGEGENDKPGEEENQNVGSPNAGIGEPLCIPVEIRRRGHLNVELSHHRR